jgi:hypothetical protein
MFQPRVKLEFVRRYCAPTNGWCVCVDIDPSEEGRTGSKRETVASRKRQIDMQADAPRVRQATSGTGSDGARRKACPISKAIQTLSHMTGLRGVV